MSAFISKLPFNSPVTRPLVMFSTWLIVAVLALGVSVINYNLRGLTARNQLAGEVTALQFASEQVMADLLNAETAQRGYLLTGDPAYLEPYTRARNRLDGDFVRLRAAPLGTSARTAQIESIRALSAVKLAELAETIELHDAGQVAAAIALVKTNHDKHTMDAIRMQLESLQAAASARLSREPANSLPWTLATTLLPLAVLLLAGLLWVKRRIELDTRMKFYRLERFTRAFGLAKGTMRDLDGRILFWDSGAQRVYGHTAEAAIGRLFYELLQTKHSCPIEEIHALLLREGEWQGEFVCRHKDGRELHLMSHWALSKGKAGEPDVVIEISTDITAIKNAEQERERAHALLQTIVETTPGLIYAKDRQGRMVMANASALRLIGKSWAEVQGRTDAEFLDDPDQGAQVTANDQRIMEHGLALEVEEAVGVAQDRARIWSSIKTPLRDTAGGVTGLIGVSVEITERKRDEDRLRLMVHELNHRVKNTLATVQAIASQTLRGGDGVLRQKLEARLFALAAAHDVLTREKWEYAALQDVVAETLAAFGGSENNRFKARGPPLRLTPRAALALTMGLHELATNALKNGALASLSGTVDILWEVSAGEEKRFRLSWTERGAGPITAPAKFGFGIRLIERTLAQDLGGVAAVHFDDPEGVRCIVEAPLAKVAASSGMIPLLAVGAQAGGD
jgi:PAS domain S-box-containing protein